MDHLVPVVLAIAIIASLLIVHKIRTLRSTKQRNAALADRQKAIQSAIDAFGPLLDDRATTVKDGESALQATVTRLQELGVHEDLPELIADTESFFNEWRASRLSA